MRIRAEPSRNSHYSNLNFRNLNFQNENLTNGSKIFSKKKKKKLKNATELLYRNVRTSTSATFIENLAKHDNAINQGKGVGNGHTRQAAIYQLQRKKQET